MRWSLRIRSLCPARHHFVALLAYGVLTLALTYPLFLKINTHIVMLPQVSGWMPGDGDPWHALWAFWWYKAAFFELQKSAFTDYVCYPIGMHLGYFFVFAYLGLFSLILQQIVSLTTTYNLLFLLSFLLSGYGAYVLAFYLTENKAASFISGIIFAFNPFRFAHALEHLNLVNTQWIPFYILFLLKAVQNQDRKHWILASFFLLLTNLSSWYFTVYLFVFTVAYVCYYALQSRNKQRIWRAIRKVGSIVLLYLVLIFYFVYPLIREARGSRILFSSLLETNQYSADLLSFFIPSPMHPLFGHIVGGLYNRFTGNLFEQTVFIGYAVLILGVLGAVKGPKKATRFWIFGCALFFLLSLGPILHIYGRFTFNAHDLPIVFPLPYLIFSYLPVWGAMRVPSRFAVMLILSLSILAGYGGAYLFETIRVRALGVKHEKAITWGGLCMLVAVIVFEFLTVPLPTLSTEIPEIYTRIGQDKTNCSVLEIPLDWKICTYQYFQIAHQKRLINGHMVRPLPSYVEFGDNIPFFRLLKNPGLIESMDLTPADRIAALDVAHALRIKYVLLHKSYLALKIADRIDRSIQMLFDGQRIYDQDQIVAYRVGDASPIQADNKSSRTLRRYMLYGWSPKEQAAEAGFDFNWSSAKESLMILALPCTYAPQHPTVIAFRWMPISAIYPELPEQTVQLFINGQFVEELHLQPRWRVQRVAILPSVLQPGGNLIHFVYKYTISPYEHTQGANADPRLLAVALDEVSIKGLPGK